MAEETRTNLGYGPRRGYPLIGPFYTKMTTPRTERINMRSARDIFGSLSQTSQFKVALHLTNTNLETDPLMSWLTESGLTKDIARNTEFDFMCNEAVLPGSNLDVTSEMGSRQGIVENMALKRVYSPVNLTFYVDNNYQIIRIFEEWMNFINPVHGSGGAYPQQGVGFGNSKNRNDFHRVRYPDEYKRIVSIVKFERNFARHGTQGESGGLNSVPSITYRLIDAFPTQVTAIPVTYEGSTITKCSVEFAYSRYVYESHHGNVILQDELSPPPRRTGAGTKDELRDIQNGQNRTITGQTYFNA